ncbi:hypothetical protein BST61_g9586 [Cercospora zeina]
MQKLSRNLERAWHAEPSLCFDLRRDVDSFANPGLYSPRLPTSYEEYQCSAKVHSLIPTTVARSLSSFLRLDHYEYTTKQHRYYYRP